MSSPILLPDGTKVDARLVDTDIRREIISLGDPIRVLPDRVKYGRLVYALNFDGPRPGIWNDGAGFIMIDRTIPFPGLRGSLRVATDGVSAGSIANPGRTAVTAGVIAKLRLHENFRQIWGVSGYVRFTSLNNSSGSRFSVSIYNRTGIAGSGNVEPTQEARHFRLWLDPNGNNQNLVGRILDGEATAAANPGNEMNGSAAAVYYDAVVSNNQNGAGSHTYDPNSGRLDEAGGWHYWELWGNFATGDYVRVVVDSVERNFAPNEKKWDVTTSGGFAGMHHSIEFHGTTTSRRFVNVAAMRGYILEQLP